MEKVSVMIKGEQFIDLPPGFRFHPTDEEIITHYLSAKVLNRSFSARAIGEVDLNMCEPWDLPRKAKMGEKEWYFFCQRDRKYPTGMRTNRATEAGYWKATGKDKEICKGRATLLGMKKTLVFYKGRAPKGEKSNWVMHEYRLEGKLSCYNLSKTVKDEWVVCRIFQKNTGIKRSPISGLLRINPSGDHELDASNFLPPLMDSPYLALDRAGSNFIEDGFKFKETAAMRASDGIYLPFSTDMEEPENKKKIGASNQGYNDVLPFENSNFYSQVPHPNQVFTMQASSNLGSLHQEGKNPGSFFSNSGFGYTCGSNLQRQRCKVEQCSDFSYLEQNRDFPLEEQPRYGLSNQQQSFISVSQETGLSTDINTEISSVVSKHELVSTFYEDPEDLSAAEPVDLDCLWNY